MAETIILPWVPFFAVLALSTGLLGVIGWIYTTRLRIQNGYPLENSWGKAIYPKIDQDAQLRAELGSIKDRLANVERIVTDEAHGLTREIEQLRSKPAN